jgi:DNA-binding NarL/FixJ family response regulator
MSIRIFIIDEHRSAREILARRLTSQSDIEVVGTAGNGEYGLSKIHQLRPDLVLLDPKMKAGNGMDVCRRACSINSGPKVTVLTSYVNPEERRTAIQSGVEGYLLKEVDTENLVAWIRHVTSSNEESVPGA